VEQKWWRWDIMTQQGQGWTSYHTQLINQASAFARASQTAPIQSSSGVAIHERIIVFTSKIPPGLESKATELEQELLNHYQQVFWGL
jgi:hypothetical protein